jgi:holo-[acyl-carrier protein] synthase
MPTEVGIDLVGHEEIEDALRRGNRYLRRIYTEEELDVCGDNPKLLAACFAAKEAAMKALRRTDEPVPWRSIALRMAPGAPPSLELSGPAQELAQARGVTRLAVSVSHRDDQAMAVVLAHTGQGR